MRNPNHDAALNQANAMLTYGELIEIGEKGERLGFWTLSFPCIPDGRLGLSVLRERWKFLPVPNLEAMAELGPVLAEIRRRRET